MTHPRVHLLIVLAGMLAAWIAPQADAQVSRSATPYASALSSRRADTSTNPWSASLASNVIIPQTRAFAIRQPEVVEISGVSIDVLIVGQTATTTMDIHLRNPSSRRLEAELVVPVPDKAVVRGFAFEGPAAEPVARVLFKDEARATYDGLVAKIRDPALLEFLGYDLVRSSVFPVEARGTQKVRLIYEHLLPLDGSRVDYVLPRSESLDYAVPWTITVRVRSARPISTMYSPSHTLETERLGPGDIAIRLAPGAGMEPGPFRLSYLFEDGALTASLLAYPDLKGDGGYFLLLAGTPAEAQEPHASARRDTASPLRREVILALDCSGSMSGEKIEQVRQAAFQVVSALKEGETFNLIVYNEGVDLFAPAPVVRSETTLREARAYLTGIRAQGGTNIHEALLTALHQKSSPGALPMVLFLTDGLPTIGQTSEAAIRNAAAEQNPERRRIFTFGVGVDVNAPLLDQLASCTRGRSTYVLPEEDIEVKVARQFECLAGPVLANPEISIEEPDGASARKRVRDMIPAQLPDLFEGDQLVLLGRYTGDGPLAFELTGNLLGEPETFRYRFAMDKATTRNAFVPRLWASRRIATLIDAIRQMGAGSPPRYAAASHAAALPDDPRFEELVGEIVRLSTEFGILTEYTAFLAEEGTDLSSRDQLITQAGRNLNERAVAVRSGKGAVGQSMNYMAQVGQEVLNHSNSFVYLGDPADFQNARIQRNTGATLKSNASRAEPETRAPGGAPEVSNVSFSSVQQVNDRAFFKRHGQWIDSRILGRADEGQPARVIEFGSNEFRDLARELTQEGRQGTIALRGDILLEVHGERILVRAPAGS
jgi:Ca-activated chloride channel family protein